MATDDIEAEATDGSTLDVTEKGDQDFSLWGCTFSEVVRVIRENPATILIGHRFWRQYLLKLDLEDNYGIISKEIKRYVVD